MNTMTSFDWIVLVGLVLLVSIWLVRRIRASLKASCCSTDNASCAGCGGSCGKGNKAQAAQCCDTAGMKKPD